MPKYREKEIEFKAVTLRAIALGLGMPFGNCMLGLLQLDLILDINLFNASKLFMCLLLLYPANQILAYSNNL